MFIRFIIDKTKAILLRQKVEKVNQANEFKLLDGLCTKSSSDRQGWAKETMK